MTTPLNPIITNPTLSIDARRTMQGDMRIEMNNRLDHNWDRVFRLTQDLVVEKLGDRDAGAAHAIMLNDLRHDRNTDNVCVLGMRRAPASKDRHHDREGGLVVHLLEMWDIWLTDYAHIIRQYGTPHPQINDATVWRTILYHDLNKVWRYRLESEEPWRVDYANREDKVSQLVGHHKTFWWLHKYNIRLTLPLYNALLCSEGGYNDHRPRVETALAKLVYLLDEMSANVVDRLNTNRFWDSQRGGSLNEDVNGA